MDTLEMLIERISEKSGLSKKEIEEKIEEKVVELSYLISKEGAAYIVAKELGIDLIEKKDRSLKIKNIVPGMQNVEIEGKIMKIFDIKEFVKEGIVGRVLSMILADETSSVRVVFWNKDIAKLEGFKEGDNIKLTNAYSKTNAFGNIELHANEKTKIEKINKEINVNTFSLEEGIQRINLSEVKENQFVEIKGTIVSLIENKFFSCPECNSKVENINENYFCKDHGKVEPKENLMISGYIDDGTSALRYVAYREIAEKILSLSPIGKEFIYRGKVLRNKKFGNLELHIREVEELDVKKEIERLCKITTS